MNIVLCVISGGAVFLSNYEQNVKIYFSCVYGIQYIYLVGIQKS